MYGDRVEFRNLDELRQYVHHRICLANELEVNVFQVTERMMHRAGRPCGIFFCLHGPRSVRLTAIWETESNTLLFYGSTGERVDKIKLTDSPELVSGAAV